MNPMVCTHITMIMDDQIYSLKHIGTIKVPYFREIKGVDFNNSYQDPILPRAKPNL